MPQKLTQGINDFESWCKKNNKEYLLHEWDYVRNGLKTPSNTMYGSTYNAWWKCSKNHSYQAKMYSRAKEVPSDCPICSNRIVLVGYNDLATTHPDLAKEWHPYKNGKLTPYNVTCGMTKRVWWFLPYDDEKTGKHFDFEWETSINNRAMKKSGCPYLAGRVWTGYNDLQTLNPEMAKDWDYDKNDAIPSNVSPNDNHQFYWKCHICGYEWKTSLNSRSSNKYGCPQCSKEKSKKTNRTNRINRIKKVGSLAVTNPQLAKEWHPIKNGKLTPYDVTGGCKEKVWWLLPYDDKNTGKHFDFEWQAQVYSRNRFGTGCPFLSGRLWKGFNDITITNHNIIKYWHPTKNGTLTPDSFTKGSHEKVWWICNYGHTFKSEISTQCVRFGCPVCNKEKQTSFPEQAIFYYVRQIFPDAINSDRTTLEGLELDIYIPSQNVGIEYDGAAWHKNTDKDLRKEIECKKRGILLIRVREDDCVDYESNSFLLYHYKYGDWESLNVVITNICGYLSDTKVDVSIDRDIHKIEEMYLADKQNNSVAVTNPELLSLWHPTRNGNLKLSYFNRGSQKLAWWMDSYGHEYRCPINQMTDGGEHCPYCLNRKLLVGFNDLNTRFPDVASEWDYDRNNKKPSEVIYSKGKYWFKCNTCGYRWHAYLTNRIRGNGCPACGHVKQRRIRAEKNNNDHYGKALAIAYPELALEWDEEKNKMSAADVYSFSIRKEKYWWKCRTCDYEWQSTIKNRTKGRGCPNCSFKKANKKVQNIDTGEVFDSVTKASSAYSCNVSSIINCCKGRIKTCKGYRWKYYNSFENDTR